MFLHSLRVQILVSALALVTIVLLAVTLFSTRATVTTLQETQTVTIHQGTPHSTLTRKQSEEPPPGGLARRLNQRIWIATFIAIASAVLLSFLLSGYIVTPLRQTTAAVTQMALGDYNARAPARGTSELAILGAAFNELAVRLQAAEQARVAMVSDVAHELRTPINNLQGQIEALSDGLATLTPERITMLRDETERLGSLVADLQQLTLSDAGQIDLQLQPLPPCEFLAAASRGIEGIALRKGVHLSVVCDPALPLMHADPQRLRHVLVNILSNAIRHTPAGTAVTTTVVEDSGFLRFRILDAGGGIAPEYRERIFERFFRGDPSRSRDTGGTGLGLAIAKRFVEAHGGTIGAQNGENGGAQITFTVPRYCDEPGGSPPG